MGWRILKLSHHQIRQAPFFTALHAKDDRQVQQQVESSSVWGRRRKIHASVLRMAVRLTVFWTSGRREGCGGPALPLEKRTQMTSCTTPCPSTRSSVKVGEGTRRTGGLEAQRRFALLPKQRTNVRQLALSTVFELNQRKLVRQRIDWHGLRSSPRPPPPLPSPPPRPMP